MIQFIDYGVNEEAKLYFNERKDEPRCLDILNQLDIQKGDEVTVDILIKHGDKANHIQFNRKIKHVLNGSCEFEIVKETGSEIKTDISKELVLE